MDHFGIKKTSSEELEFDDIMRLNFTKEDIRGRKRIRKDNNK